MKKVPPAPFSKTKKEVRIDFRINLTYKEIPSGTEFVLIEYFNDSSSASAFYNSHLKAISDWQDYKDKPASKTSYGISGRVIYVGTKNAIKDSK